MKEERMFILNMINEGKIKAQEGEALLKALACCCGNNETIGNVKNKVMEFAKEKEPKVKQLVQGLAEKSADVMECVSKGIKEHINSEENLTMNEND